MHRATQGGPVEAVIGATGYIGGRLIDRLLGEGRPVRALARNPSHLAGRPALQSASVDLLSGRGLERALEGCSVAYYLVHSMEDPRPGRRDAFASRDRRAAEAFVGAAKAAGLERVVYLGGIVPRSGPESPHLASRLEVETILLDGLPRSTALRASIVIGAASASFRILVRLIERLRLLPLPAWRRNRTQPIDERDAIEFLARTPSARAAEGRSLDIAGPDVLSYAAMIERIADLMGVGRAPIGLPASATPMASAVVSEITGQPLGLVRPLMESLEHDLLPRDDEAAGLYGLRLRPFDRSVDRALRDWEEREQLAAR
jgi:uncharacterized protein YbjT (DUF2867 family)